MRGTFDRTQWERTRFAKEALAKPTSTTAAVERGECQQKGAPLIGELRQILAVRGEYLNKKPMFTIALLLFELIWCVACAAVWLTTAVNPITPTVVSAFNLVVVCLLTLGCFGVEFFRFHVKTECSEHSTRLFVPYNWKFTIFEVHLARAALLCANITIMALDNERDAGSIVVLAATPVQLICVAIHIFLALTTN